jgi:hypothetical protein
MRIRSICARCSRSWPAQSWRMRSRLSSPRSPWIPTLARSHELRVGQVLDHVTNRPLARRLRLTTIGAGTVSRNRWSAPVVSARTTTGSLSPSRPRRPAVYVAISAGVDDAGLLKILTCDSVSHGVRTDRISKGCRSCAAPTRAQTPSRARRRRRPTHRSARRGEPTRRRSDAGAHCR